MQKIKIRTVIKQESINKTKTSYFSKKSQEKSANNIKWIQGQSGYVKNHQKYDE